MINREDISDGKEIVKIPIENRLDDENPDYFQYVRVNVPSANCPRDRFEIQYAGCECCESVDLCSDERCLCVRLKSCGPSYDGNRRLLTTVSDNSKLAKPVYECNGQCCCAGSGRCQNHVTQTGLGVGLRVVKTRTKGWALVTEEAIIAGSFVCEYAGEVLSRTEAKERTAVLKSDDRNYIIAVNEHLADGRTLSTYVDPSRVGNVGRFANHSCDPNLTVVPVRIEHAVPKLALFARRDIQSGEELCFDYSGCGECRIDPGLADGPTVKRKPCFCDSVNCRRFLPYDDALFEA